jgi:hypothetical protein
MIEKSVCITETQSQGEQAWLCVWRKLHVEFTALVPATSVFTDALFFTQLNGNATNCVAGL